MTILLLKFLLVPRSLSGCRFKSFHFQNYYRFPFNTIFAFNYMATSSSSSSGPANNTGTPFLPKKALILTKFSRYEFEKRRHAGFSEEELMKNLEERGSDYNNLLQHHKIHVNNRNLVIKTLEENGIETKVVNRFDYTDSNIDWADVIFTTGGDGTFLMAASKIRSRNKPLIGINSDPTRSLGYLCLPSLYTENFPEAIRKLKSGNFRWMHRQRIKVTLVGEHACHQPIELHDQQLQYPEYRFLDCVEGHITPIHKHAKVEHKESHELSVRALNEVFVGESLSSSLHRKSIPPLFCHSFGLSDPLSKNDYLMLFLEHTPDNLPSHPHRVSYYEFSVDAAPKEKLKSSGLTVCTGTGSSSWSFNINKVTEQCVQHLLKITSEETQLAIPATDKDLVSKITSKFNNSLIFDPTKQRMAYTIRDPVVFGMGFKCKPRGFAKKIEVKSRMFDACLVIDGGLSYAFNDGSTATLEIDEEDALLTVSLPEQ